MEQVCCVLFARDGGVDRRREKDIWGLGGFAPWQKTGDQFVELTKGTLKVKSLTQNFKYLCCCRQNPSHPLTFRKTFSIPKWLDVGWLPQQKSGGRAEFLSHLVWWGTRHMCRVVRISMKLGDWIKTGVQSQRWPQEQRTPGTSSQGGFSTCTPHEAGIRSCLVFILMGGETPANVQLLQPLARASNTIEMQMLSALSRDLVS